MQSFIYIYIYIEHLSGEHQKSEVLLIASTLFVVKAENIYQNTTKMHKTMEQSLAFKQLLDHSHVTYMTVRRIFLRENHPKM